MDEKTHEGIMKIAAIAEKNNVSFKELFQIAMAAAERKRTQNNSSSVTSGNSGFSNQGNASEADEDSSPEEEY